MINGQELETRDGFGFWDVNSLDIKQLQKQVLIDGNPDTTLIKKKLDYNAQKLILKLKYGNVLEKNITGHIGTQKYLCTIGENIMDEPRVLKEKTLARSFSTPSLFGSVYPLL
jgi:hypothetical protein